MTDALRRSLDDAARVLWTALVTFRSTFLDLAWTDLIYKLVALVLLGPISSLVLRLSLWLGGSSVVADQDILFFALSPLGLAGLVMIVAVALAVVAMEQACLIPIGVSAADHAPVSQVTAVRLALARSPTVVALMAHVTARVLLMAAPFLLLIAGVYVTVLGSFDINYYLSERPVEFWIALGISAMLLVGLAFLLVPRLIGWGLSLPLVVLEHQSAREALRLSRERAVGRRLSIGMVFMVWSATSLLVASTAIGAVMWLGRSVAPSVRGSLGLALVLMLGVIVLWFVVTLLVSFFQAASFALLLTELYRTTRHPTGTESRLEMIEPRRAAWGWIPASRRQILGALAIASIVAIGVAAYLLLGLDHDREIAVIAHRGASGRTPENTRVAIERAIADGAGFVEVDVQETLDGEIVVLHDSDLMRASGLNLKVRDASWSQLENVDIGSWFGLQFDDQRVIRLVDALEIGRGRVTIMIELKHYGYDVRLEERVIETVEAAGMEAEVVLMSLNRESVEELRRLRPGWTVGLLAATAVGDLTSLDTDFLAVRSALVTRDLVRRAHARNKDVYVWTINDPVQMVRMISLGVDGLITDLPDTARHVLDEAAGMNSVERLVIALSYFFGTAAPDPPAEAEVGA